MAAVTSGKSPVASGGLPPTAGRVVVTSGKMLQPPVTTVSGSPVAAAAAALPLQQRTTRVIRCSPTSSLRLGTPGASANLTGSFRLATPISATPKVLWPGTPTPYPVANSNLSFGVSHGSQASSGVPAEMSAPAPVAPAPQPAAAMPQGMMPVHQQQFQYVMLPNGQIVMQAPQMMMPAMQVSSPGGTVYQPAQQGFVAMPGYLPQPAACGGLSAPGSPGSAAEAQPQALPQAPAPAAAEASPRRVVVKAVGGVLPQGASSSSCSAAAAGGGTAVLTPEQAAAVASGQLPSMGSALHDGTGKCSPCAWFWKQRGCQSGAQCGYCHLCPEGELKNRKKAKIAAIKMGVIEPQHPKGAPHHQQQPQRANLKLNTLL